MKSEADDNEARQVFGRCVAYLTKRGWVRNGDDPGVWMKPGETPWWTFALALTFQLAEDGVRETEEGDHEDEGAEKSRSGSTTAYPRIDDNRGTFGRDYEATRIFQARTREDRSC